MLIITRLNHKYFSEYKILALAGLAGLLVVTVIFAATQGALHISAGEIWQIILNKLFNNPLPEALTFKANIFWQIRLPRITLSVLIGSSLSIAGAAMQGLFRNPLADPALIGISSGASFTAVLYMVFFSYVPVLQFLNNILGYYALNFFTFLGACFSLLLIYKLSVSNGKVVIATMLLMGIALNALFNSFMGLIIYTTNDTQLRSVTFWLMGSLGGASWQIILTILPFMALPLVLMPLLGRQLNVLALGESEALHLGTSVNRLKIYVIILATLAVGASVAVSGIILFVGLVVPHIIRLVISPDYRLLIPASALFGATLLTCSDTLARTIVAPAELPIGILTALFGSPVLIWILLNEKKKHLS